MKPFWVGFQLALGVIAACLAIPLLLFLIGLAQAHPHIWSALLTPVGVGALGGGLMAGLRNMRHS